MLAAEAAPAVLKASSFERSTACGEECRVSRNKDWIDQADDPRLGREIELPQGLWTISLLETELQAPILGGSDLNLAPGLQMGNYAVDTGRFRPRH